MRVRERALACIYEMMIGKESNNRHFYRDFVYWMYLICDTKLFKDVIQTFEHARGAEGERIESEHHLENVIESPRFLVPGEFSVTKNRITAIS